MSDMGGAARTPRHIPGLHIGRVARVTSAGVFITVARMWGANEAGPCEMCEFPGTPAITTGPGSGDAHTHLDRPAGNALAPGDRVLVGFVEANPDRPVIIGRLPAG